MRTRAAVRAAWIVAVACGAAWVLAACGGDGDGGGARGKAPQVVLGKDMCAVCGMTVLDARFMAAVEDERGTQYYDAIECLAKALRTAGASPARRVWIADFDTGTLHPEPGMTLVLGGYPSPMGGGWAAFADSSRAAIEARQRAGAAGRLEDAVRGSLRRGSP